MGHKNPLVLFNTRRIPGCLVRRHWTRNTMRYKQKLLSEAPTKKGTPETGLEPATNSIVNYRSAKLSYSGRFCTIITWGSASLWPGKAQTLDVNFFRFPKKKSTASLFHINALRVLCLLLWSFMTLECLLREAISEHVFFGVILASFKNSKSRYTKTAASLFSAFANLPANFIQSTQNARVGRARSIWLR